MSYDGATSDGGGAGGKGGGEKLVDASINFNSRCAIDQLHRFISPPPAALLHNSLGIGEINERIIG